MAVRRVERQDLSNLEDIDHYFNATATRVKPLGSNVGQKVCNISLVS
jgi:hypothetical protein